MAVHAEKTIFVHIPKTGGSSFAEMLRHVYPDGRCVFIYSHDPDYLKARREEAQQADAICGHLSFGIHEVLGIQARYVTMLRNPVDRVVSLYRHQARDPDSECYRLIAEGMTLKDLLRSEQSAQYNNHMVRIVTSLRDSEPAYDRHILDLAETNLDANFDFVGVTERFDESVVLLARTLGWPTIPLVPRLNVDPELQSVTVDDETRAEILRFNALDVDLYGRVVAEEHPYATLPP